MHLSFESTIPASDLCYRKSQNYPEHDECSMNSKRKRLKVIDPLCVGYLGGIKKTEVEVLCADRE